MIYLSILFVHHFQNLLLLSSKPNQVAHNHRTIEVVSMFL
jgi:hypothetical protein